MIKNLTLLIFTAFSLFAKAQSPVVPLTQPFGKIDIADLEMKECPFEKDANAEVLFDVGDGYVADGFNWDMHKRIKIFNDKGAHNANQTIRYYSYANLEYITGLEAETINLNNGKIEITKVDKKQIIIQRVDSRFSTLAFAFPNVKAGSVIEFKYHVHSEFVPGWIFQNDIPERYNQCTVQLPDWIVYKVQLHGTRPFVKNKLETVGGANRQVYAMANIPAFTPEPLMSSREDNIQSVSYHFTGVVGSFDGTWDAVGRSLINDYYFGQQMNINLSGQKEILKNAQLLATPKQKIAYIFNAVKNIMRWNDIDTWYPNSGVNTAWESKTGNATEINLILQSLLVSAGFEAYPLMVSTHTNGKINPAYPSLFGFNRAVVYVPADDGKFLVLDASGKYNTYDEIPDNLLNSFGLLIDKEHKIFKTYYIDNESPVKEAVFINAEIKPDGTMDGTAQKSSYGYHKVAIAENYKKNGEEKYKDFLKDKDNNLNILNFKLENMDVDTLPLKENINFKMNLPESDGTYIYFNPNIFSSLKINPFSSDSRLTDIDLCYLNSYSSTGIYKMPADYKVESLPKSVSMAMPDKSISFTRIIAQQESVISVRYIIDYQKSIFIKENYAEVKEFYRKMFELINEQIVLKKI